MTGVMKIQKVINTISRATATTGTVLFSMIVFCPTITLIILSAIDFFFKYQFFFCLIVDAKFWLYRVVLTSFVYSNYPILPY